MRVIKDIRPRMIDWKVEITYYWSFAGIADDMIYID